MAAGVDGHLGVELGALVARQPAPLRHGLLEVARARPARPSTHSKVVSSGAIMPARPPPSMVMLQTVMRPSIERPWMAGPEYSITWPTPPSTPIRPIVARIRSLAVTPGGSSPE